MKLIADSGSTKTDWVLLNDEQSRFGTSGFNPFHRSEDFIVTEIRKNDGLMKICNDVTSIHFYGAGCSSESRNSIVKNALLKVFPKATVIVDHDLVACAHSLYNDKPIFATILGTGTNACYFDGKTIAQKKPALGYVLGDEGSGSYLGKQLVTKFLYHELPEELSTAFFNRFKVGKDEVLEQVYMQPGANTYLASFAVFYGEHKEHQYLQDIIRNSFKTFFETHVICYENHQQIEANFIGSIAANFEDELRTVANSLGVKMGNVIQKPMEGLIRYHLQHDEY